MTRREMQIAALERKLADVTMELAKLRDRAEEPEVGTIVRFTRKFGTPKAYDYAAIRADNGKWYITGGFTGAYTWDELLDFANGTDILYPTGWTADGSAWTEG